LIEAAENLNRWERAAQLDFIELNKLKPEYYGSKYGDLKLRAASPKPRRPKYLDSL
jgi:hypothetical protein